MLQPKKTKYRKAFKGRIHGATKGGSALNFGASGAGAGADNGSALCASTSPLNTQTLIPMTP